MTKPKQYLNKIRKQKSINQTIKKGITQTTMKNIYNITPQQIQQRTEMMLKPLIQDKELLRIMSKEENIKKVAHRIEYRIDFQDKTNQTLAKTNKYNTTPTQIIKELQTLVKDGEEIDEDTYDRPTKIRKKLEKAGYGTFEYHKNGHVKNIQVQMIFRKGK